MKKYTIEEIKNYLMSQDSLGDIHYNLSEENIDNANVKVEDEEFYDEYIKERAEYESRDELDAFPEDYYEWFDANY